MKLTANINITSLGDTMLATISPTEFVVWAKGTHTANIYINSNPIAADVFTFGWAKNTTTQLDFTLALETYYLCQDPRRIY
jgi:hypothetical protein